jgi:uroporphyrinogen decarboxylase
MQSTIEKYPNMIGAMTAMDLTTEAETFGCDVHFSDREAPRTINEIAKDRTEIENLRVPSITEGRGPIFVEAAKLTTEAVTDRPTFGGVLGPFSLAAVLMGIEPTLKSLRKDPEAVHMLLDKCTDYIIEYAKAYKEAGVHGILLAEPTAGLLSPKQCDEFSSKYVKKLVDAVQDDYFFVVLHNCGRTTKMVGSMVSTGAKGYHFGNAVDMLDILPQIPEEYLVFGNIDPSRVMSHGTPEEVRKETLDLLEKMKPYPHYVLSSGCDLPPGVPIENLDAYFAAQDEFNRSK